MARPSSLWFLAPSVVALVACGGGVMMGDAPDGACPAADAGAGATGDAGPEDAGMAGDAGPRDAEVDGDARPAPVGADAGPGEEGGTPASCLDVHQRDPSAPSGVYPISVDGQTLDAYCDMTLDHGGWTAFYAGTLGARNVFAHFDRGGYLGAPPDVCDAPASRCLRHLPSTVTLQTRLAAACGPNAVGFSPTAEILDYFHAGTPQSWLTVGAPTALTPSAHAEWATYLWTGGQLTDGGSDGNLGWILSNAAFPDDPDRVHTFASAYDSRSWGWDYCDGQDYNDVGAAGGGRPEPRVYLLYR